MAKYTANEDNLAEMLENLIDILGQAGKIFESSKPEVQNEFLRILVSNSVLEGEKVRISLQKPFEKLLGNPDYLLWLSWVSKSRTNDYENYITLARRLKDFYLLLQDQILI